MNNKITNIILALLVLVVAYGVFKNHSLDLNLSEHKNNIITISGKAEKEVVPDTAKISFAVNEYDKNQKKASDKVTKKINSMIDMLEDLDIDDKNIKTQNISIYPEYDWSSGKRIFRAYKASQRVVVKIKDDLEKAQKVMAKLVDLKVDNLNGPNMFVDDRDKVLEDLREKAIKNAKEKAEKLADELGVKLEKIVGFSENNSRNYYPRPMYKSLALDAVAESAPAIEPEIKAGTEKITKTVSISFQIED